MKRRREERKEKKIWEEKNIDTSALENDRLMLLILFLLGNVKISRWGRKKVFEQRVWRLEHYSINAKCNSKPCTTHDCGLPLIGSVYLLVWLNHIDECQTFLVSLWHPLNDDDGENDDVFNFNIYWYIAADVAVWCSKSVEPIYQNSDGIGNMKD